MVDELQALHAKAVRPTKGKSAAPEGPDGVIRGSRGSPIRIRDMDKGHYNKLRTTHRRLLLRILGAWCKLPNKRTLSYKDALKRTECESIETTVRTRRLVWWRPLLHMGDHRLPKRVVSGEQENAGNCGPEGKEKE